MARQQGLKVGVITYMQQNVDRVVTLDELERELPASRGSISSTISKLINDGEFPMESMGSGLYRWNTNGVHREEYSRGDLMEIILVKDDSKRILMRDDHGDVWVARRLDLEEL